MLLKVQFNNLVALVVFGKFTEVWVQFHEVVQWALIFNFSFIVFFGDLPAR